MAGLGGPQMRDGTYEYYMSEPVVEDDAKGVGPFLLAYTEIQQIRRVKLKEVDTCGNSQAGILRLNKNKKAGKR